VSCTNVSKSTVPAQTPAYRGSLLEIFFGLSRMPGVNTHGRGWGAWSLELCNEMVLVLSGTLPPLFCGSSILPEDPESEKVGDGCTVIQMEGAMRLAHSVYEVIGQSHVRRLRCEASIGIADAAFEIRCAAWRPDLPAHVSAVFFVLSAKAFENIGVR
jgi:hypothetical protein